MALLFKKKGGKKDLKFDELEEKTIEKEMGKMTIKPKNERKYSPSPAAAEERRNVVEGKSNATPTQLFQKLVQKETERVGAVEVKKDPVGFSLFETANLMSSIVDITKDSTMRRRANTSDDVAPPKPNKKTPSRSSLTSQTSQSGPFATLKENAEKKKKSFDEEEQDLSEPIA